jgi:hypothetical protein
MINGHHLMNWLLGFLSINIPTTYVEILHNRIKCQLVDINGTGTATIRLSKSAPLMVGNQIQLIFNTTVDPLLPMLKGRVVHISPDMEELEMNRISIVFMGTGRNKLLS